MGRADTTLYIKHVNKDILIIQIYVDDILFRSTNDNLCQEFFKTIQSEFEMSHKGELNYFLGLQIKQMNDEIFIFQYKYAKELLKRFGMKNSSSKSNP